ncbi:Lacal_2735 family protein [Marivirga sp.]|uniref:Lacal_2735 family protein n=2 Tax=Marivirga sp. TaxID=2018662 RepID=UPI0039C91F5D
MQTKEKTMFGLFKKKSEKEKLNEEYKKLLAEYHKLSSIDRKKADQKMAEAEEVAKKMDAIKE